MMPSYKRKRSRDIIETLLDDLLQRASTLEPMQCHADIIAIRDFQGTGYMLFTTKLTIRSHTRVLHHMIDTRSSLTASRIFVDADGHALAIDCIQGNSSKSKEVWYYNGTTGHLLDTGPLDMQMDA